MSLLADENFPAVAVTALREAGFDVLWVAEESAGIDDEQVIELCTSTGRTLLTFDKDFGELAFRSGLSSKDGVILFRVAAQAPEEIGRIAVSTIGLRPDWSGCFAVVSRHKIRIRALPGRQE